MGWKCFRVTAYSRTTAGLPAVNAGDEPYRTATWLGAVTGYHVNLVKVHHIFNWHM